ncbi:MAG: C13 family peptidase [Spirochaetaceae bacterium]
MKYRTLDFILLTTTTLLFLFSSCTSINRVSNQNSEGLSTKQSISWHAVLVAGAYTDHDLQIDNWDNAMERMADVLLNAGVNPQDIRMHSSKPQNIGKTYWGVNIEPSWKQRIISSIKSFDLQESDGLILYFSSHGKDNRGLYLESEEEFRNIFSPSELDDVLDSLGDTLLVIFISSCYSGDFITGEENIVNDNRLILTASAEDRSSFGCGAGNYMPQWDDTLLKVLKEGSGNKTWEQVISRIDEEISLKEVNIADTKKSLPQHNLPSPLNPGFNDLLNQISHNRN